MLWLKAFHVMAVIAWMAGMFYLPRLFVYHAEAKPGSEVSETFKVMDARLLDIIMRPAIIAVWLSTQENPPGCWVFSDSARRRGALGT